MTVRRILQLGDPFLRRVASGVDDATAVEEIVTDLIDTMRAANGAGLAAPQIGIDARIIVMEVDENPRYPYKPRVPLTVAINPIIEPLDDELVEINEGCLSVPVRGFVDRHVNIRVRYQDRDGMARDEIHRGLTAGTWQHECDHLDGTLIVDRADPRRLATWDEYERHYRDEFVERIGRFVAEVGS